VATIAQQTYSLFGSKKAHQVLSKVCRTDHSKSKNELATSHIDYDYQITQESMIFSMWGF
jgi:hypothetical protein